MICGNCDKTDGMVYTSLPPKVRCKISKRFHEIGDECEFEWKPIIHGHWLFNGKPIWKWSHGNCCSVCGEYSETCGNYCPYCGAEMDEVEDE